MLCRLQTTPYSILVGSTILIPHLPGTLERSLCIPTWFTTSILKCHNPPGGLVTGDLAVEGLAVGGLVAGGDLVAKWNLSIALVMITSAKKTVLIDNIPSLV